MIVLLPVVKTVLCPDVNGCVHFTIFCIHIFKLPEAAFFETRNVRMRLDFKTSFSWHKKLRRMTKDGKRQDY